jgi:urease accessory protein
MPSSTGFAATCSSSSSRTRCGRDGLLRLAFERRWQSRATALRHCRYTLPLQVLSPLTLDDGTSYLLLLNPTGGVLGGDRLRTEISLGENSSVCLSTPSATRIYRTTGAPAEMHTILRLASGATLEYLPDHVVPHAGSMLRQSLRIEMQPGSRGIFLDAFAAGRVAQNERWRFREFDSRTEVTLSGKLIYLSRTKICGAATPGGALAPEGIPFVDAQAAGGQPLATSHSSLPPYSASLLIVADQLSDWRPVVASLRAELDAVPGVIGGVSLLSEAGCSVRYLAESAIALHGATRLLWTAARREVFRLPPLDLRKY